MKYKPFSDKKDVHLDLNKETYNRCRSVAFDNGLSMQELLSGFADLIASDDPKAMTLIKGFVTAKIKREIEELKKPKPKKGQPVYTEANAEALYNMISEAKNGDHDNT